MADVICRTVGRIATIIRLPDGFPCSSQPLDGCALHGRLVGWLGFNGTFNT